MMDPARFDASLERWLDGALPADEAAAMAAWCASHPDAQARADAERAFDERVRHALRSGAAEGDTSGHASVMAALARARRTVEAESASSGAAPPGLRLAPAGAPGERQRRPPLALPRWAAGAVAAACLAAVTLWMNCIPPFECPYIQALDASASAPSAGSQEFDGIRRERVPLGLTPTASVLRSTVAVDGGEAVLLFSALPGHHPSFRRERRIGGATWWIGSENGRTVVAFEDPRNRGLWCFVGQADEATLVAAARTFRQGLGAAEK